MAKLNIALLTGGYSKESEISYKSAKTVFENLDSTKFNIYLIEITNNKWFYKQNNKINLIDKADFSLTINSIKINFDLCYIMIHGTPGEDGKMQSYFDIINIPYLSCNATTSNITFNKFYTTSILKSFGIKVANSLLLLKNREYKLSKIIPTLKFPVFVKPNNGGSSIGISKVKKQEELKHAITKAFVEDNQVIIEEQILGREFTIGICKIKKEIVVLPITEVEVKGEFFDFDAKYNGNAKETTPAKINAFIKKKLETTAKDIYTLLDCVGVIRIDMIYNEKEETPYVLEINTIPGQTNMSFIPQQIKAMKMPLKKFYTLLIQEKLKIK